MSDKKLPPMPSPEKRVLSLTDLAKRNHELSTALAAHTSSRNYLFEIANGSQALPLLTLTSFPDGTCSPQNSASLDMSRLPSEVVEMILFSMIDHEEKMAFDTWRELSMTAAAACTAVQQMSAQRATQIKQQQTNTGFPPTIPMPTQENRNEPDDSQEVPRGWPGRTAPPENDLSRGFTASPHEE